MKIVQHNKGAARPISVQNPQSSNFSWRDLPPDIEAIPVFMTAEDGAASKGMLYRRRGTTPDVGVHIMHPRTDMTLNYHVIPLTSAGYAVLARGSRWVNNDVAMIHERLLLDVAAGIRLLHEHGCTKVVLMGNSGGGSLAAFYQAQARTPAPGRLTHTPAGDPCDLNMFDLPAANAVALVGAHIGQGALLAKLIDPSVVDETDPVAADPTLDMYDPRNGFRTPPEASCYDAEFLARYRAAQLDRVRRLDARARHIVEMQRQAGPASANAEDDRARTLERTARAGWHMIVYRTTADPAFVDPSIDPDDRGIQSYIGKRPDLENYGENGFCRYVTPRAWLSTWSAVSSKAGMMDNLERFSDPLLIVHYAGDAGSRMAEAQEMLARSPSTDKTLQVVRNVDHFGFAIEDGITTSRRVSEGSAAFVAWLQMRLPLP